MFYDAFICDIDGTITDSNAWMSSEIDKLPINKDLKSIITSRDANGYPRKIFFITARPESQRDITNAFLKLHFRHIPFTLYMRQDSDQRIDTEIKKDIYIDNIVGKYNVVAAFDDKPSIVKMWRSLGIQTYEVTFNDI